MKIKTLRGKIGSWYDFSADTVEKFLKEANGEDVELRCHSFGGDVFEGVLIHNLLKSYKGKITIVNMGVLASAGSLVAMGADVYKAFSTSSHMIHKAWAFTAGNYDELTKFSKILNGIDTILAKQNEKKNKKSFKDNMKLLADETWYIGGEELKKSGLTDEIIEEVDGIEPVFDATTQNLDTQYVAEIKEYGKDYIENHPELDIQKVQNSIKNCIGDCTLASMPSTEKIENSTQGELMSKTEQKPSVEVDGEAVATAVQAEQTRSQEVLKAIMGTSFAGNEEVMAMVTDGKSTVADVKAKMFDLSQAQTAKIVNTIKQDDISAEIDKINTATTDKDIVSRAEKEADEAVAELREMEK